MYLPMYKPFNYRERRREEWLTVRSFYFYTLLVLTLVHLHDNQANCNYLLLWFVISTFLVITILHPIWRIYCSCQGSTNTSCFLRHVRVSAHRLGMGNYQLQALLLWILCSTYGPLQIDWYSFSISIICSYDHIWAVHVKQGKWKMLKHRNESMEMEVWKYRNRSTEVRRKAAYWHLGRYIN